MKNVLSKWFAKYGLTLHPEALRTFALAAEEGSHRPCKDDAQTAPSGPHRALGGVAAQEVTVPVEQRNGVAERGVDV